MGWWSPGIILSMSEYSRIPRILSISLWVMESRDNPDYVWVSQDSEDTFHQSLWLVEPSWVCLSIPGFQEYFPWGSMAWWNPGIILTMSECPRILRILSMRVYGCQYFYMYNRIIILGLFQAVEVFMTSLNDHRISTAALDMNDYFFKIC